MLIKLFIAIAALLFALYLFGAAALYIFQRNMLYIPSPEYKNEFTLLEFHNEQETLKVTVLNPGMPRAILYFGGNAEAVIFNVEPFIKNFADHTIYLSNYRGYGGSTGKPTEKGLYSDALALYDHVQPDHDSIALLGRSLGSGVATYVASQREVTHLALITPYDSIQNVAQARIPIYPINFLLKDKYDSAEKAVNVSAKALIVMAELDSIIPNSHSIKLSQAFLDDQVSILSIEGSDHINLSLDPEYFPALNQFFDEPARAN